MSRKRRNHSPEFKAKVALAAIKGDQTLAELSSQFQLHANQISQWKRELLNNASLVFNANQSTNSEEEIKKLHAKIGQITMENDFLSKALNH